MNSNLPPTLPPDITTQLLRHGVRFLLPRVEPIPEGARKALTGAAMFFGGVIVIAGLAWWTGVSRGTLWGIIPAAAVTFVGLVEIRDGLIAKIGPTIEAEVNAKTLVVRRRAGVLWSSEKVWLKDLRRLQVRYDQSKPDAMFLTALFAESWTGEFVQLVWNSPRALQLALAQRLAFEANAMLRLQSGTARPRNVEAFELSADAVLDEIEQPPTSEAVFTRFENGFSITFSPKPHMTTRFMHRLVGCLGVLWALVGVLIGLSVGASTKSPATGWAIGIGIPLFIFLLWKALTRPIVESLDVVDRQLLITWNWYLTRQHRFQPSDIKSVSVGKSNDSHRLEIRTGRFRKRRFFDGRDRAEIFWISQLVQKEMGLSVASEDEA